MKKRLIEIGLVLVVLTVPAFAQVPNMKLRIEQLAKDNPVAFACAHTKRDCAYNFVKLVACKLNPEPSEGSWGLNGRRGNLNAPSWDALNFRGAGNGRDANTGDRVQVVDFIGRAGEPDAYVNWLEFSDPAEASGGWIQPACKGDVPVNYPTAGSAPKPTPPAPVVVKAAYPGDPFGVAIGQALADDYARAGQAPNPGMGVWFFRVAWDIAINGMSPDAAIQKHRTGPGGWLEALGLK